MNPLRSLLFLALALAVGGRLSQAAEKHARPNIVFILADDQRADELGCTGNPIVKTPHIDRLARHGVLFE
ncbi:MAG: sulfatase-like hydrolase/transferase, partial [Gammaproteobacteria bacterium]